LFVAGGCCGADGKKYVIGGWAWAWCCVTEVQRSVSIYEKNIRVKAFLVA